jgi:hypothetical protein
MGYSSTRRRSCVGFWAALGLASLLAACGGGAGDNPRVTPDGSEDFQVGYQRGCDSGFTDAAWSGWEDKWSRDEDAFKKLPDYRKGWLQGYKACYKFGLAHPRTNPPGLP